MGWRRDDFVTSDTRERIDRDAAVHFLDDSYRAARIPRDLVERSINHSLPFGIYHAGPNGAERQVGFARVTSDCATFAYVGDVFVAPEFRGQGLATWLLETIVAHQDLQGLRNWILLTRDAHALYEKAGFAVSERPTAIMERRSGVSYGAAAVAALEKRNSLDQNR